LRHGIQVVALNLLSTEKQSLMQASSTHELLPSTVYQNVPLPSPLV
jgi:hypothetical protein